MSTSRALFKRRQGRVRGKLAKRVPTRPRLSVFRSSKHIYAQVIDDVAGRTLVSASSLDKDLREGLKTGADTTAASRIGEILAKRALEAGVTEVVFDRGGYRYHGRVKALADAAREAGLTF
tara:strand:+ start:1243 stop:1605 length:363 start_codon:yes stop_codon:yes gene_type:complete